MPNRVDWLLGCCAIPWGREEGLWWISVCMSYLWNKLETLEKRKGMILWEECMATNIGSMMLGQTKGLSSLVMSFWQRLTMPECLQWGSKCTTVSHHPTIRSSEATWGMSSYSTLSHLQWIFTCPVSLEPMYTLSICGLSTDPLEEHPLPLVLIQLPAASSTGCPGMGSEWVFPTDHFHATHDYLIFDWLSSTPRSFIFQAEAF